MLNVWISAAYGWWLNALFKYIYICTCTKKRETTLTDTNAYIDMERIIYENCYFYLITFISVVYLPLLIFLGDPKRERSCSRCCGATYEYYSNYFEHASLHLAIHIFQEMYLLDLYSSDLSETYSKQWRWFKTMLTKTCWR